MSICLDPNTYLREQFLLIYLLSWVVSVSLKTITSICCGAQKLTFRMAGDCHPVVSIIFFVPSSQLTEEGTFYCCSFIIGDRSRQWKDTILPQPSACDADHSAKPRVKSVILKLISLERQNNAIHFLGSDGFGL